MEHEGNHQPPSTADVKNEWSHASAPLICLIIWARTTLLFS